jgi:heme exporter protein CcmD
MEHTHTFYVAMSYGAALVAIVAEVIALRLRRARAIRGIEEERELETQD